MKKYYNYTIKIFGDLELNKGIRNCLSTFCDVVDYIIRNGYDFGLKEGDCLCKINFGTKEFVMFGTTKKGLEYMKLIKKHLENIPSYIKIEEDDYTVTFKEKCE